MKVIAREGAWASSYFRTAINHCIEADQILERVLATDDLSEQSILDEHMNEAGAITIVFSAMCIEAYMNDYLAQRMGDSTFYKHYERNSSEKKLSLVLGPEILARKDEVRSAVKQLFEERHRVVHAKSYDISYESNVDENQVESSDADDGLTTTTYFRDYCTSYASRANKAICAVLLLGEYMQRKEPAFRTDASLLGLNALPILSMEIINKIQNLCNTLRITLPISPEYTPHVEVPT